MSDATLLPGNGLQNFRTHNENLSFSVACCVRGGGGLCFRPGRLHSLQLCSISHCGRQISLALQTPRSMNGPARPSECEFRLHSAHNTCRSCVCCSRQFCTKLADYRSSLKRSTSFKSCRVAYTISQCLTVDDPSIEVLVQPSLS